MKAIITGDIIKSRSLKAAQLVVLVDDFNRALRQWNKDFSIKSEITRGDSFQCYIKNPVDSLKIALIIKTYLRSNVIGDAMVTKSGNFIKTKVMASESSKVFDARIAIGIGTVDFISKKLATSNGEAFELSGKLLDKMKGKKQSIGITTADHHNEELQVELSLLDAILSKTTPNQCQVLNYKLLGYNEIEIAQKLRINQSAVNQRSISGNWNAIEILLKRFENLYSYE